MQGHLLYIWRNFHRCFIGLASLAIVLSSPVVAKEVIITAASPVGFSTFDPFLAAPPSVDYLRPVYDSLVIKLGQDHYEPGLAKSFSYNSVTKKFRLKLRKNIYFSDGVPFNAAAVKANFEHGKKIKRSAWASFYANIDAVETPASDVVVLDLKNSDPTLLESLQVMPGMMVSPAALANVAHLATHPVGIGPWTLDQDRTVFDEKHTYVKTRNYWDATVHQVDTYVILHIPDSAARVNALRGGQVDIASIGPEQSGVMEKFGFQIIAPNSIFQVLQIGDAKGEVVAALGDRRVRRAIGYAMDRAAILKVLYANRGAARTNFYPTGVLGHSDRLEKIDLYNLSQARALMKAAGYENGFNVDVAVQPQSARVATVVAGELAKIGVHFNITVMPDSGSWLAVYRQRQSPVGILAQRMVPPYGMWSSFVARSGHYNPFQLDWPEMNLLAQKAADTTTDDSGQQARLYAALIEHMVFDDAILFPIAVVELVAAMRQGIGGNLVTFSGAGLPNPRYLLVNQ